MKLLLQIITVVIFTFIVNKEIKSQNKIENQILKISVNGLVCDFCARSIEKLFRKKESVESINVDLENMLITIYLKKGKNINNTIVTQLIKDSGYDVTEINREK
tara:strand:- start:1679 stop:1990 length:312 start_codon:yes stop_codon:yes gene_type:complete